MNPVASDTVCVYGARIIKKHLASLEAQIEGVKAAEDIEAIHQMRVASRRMRSALAIFSPCFRKPIIKSILKDVRGVTSALGEARDLDVHLEYIKGEAANYASSRLAPGIRRLILRLTQKRQDIQAHVTHAMEKFIKDDVIGELREWSAPLLANTQGVYLYSPALYHLAFDVINRSLDELESHEQIVRDPNEVAELHAMRISAKRLRYTLEAFEDLYGDPIKPYLSAVKQIQEILGNVHDLDVWIAMIPEFIEEEKARIVGYYGHAGPLKRLLPGLEAFKEAQLEKRGQTYVEFIQEWDTQKADGVWVKLRRLINTPIDLEAALRAAPAEVSAIPEPTQESDDLK
jgi:CHAD domain-containing protein